MNENLSLDFEKLLKDQNLPSKLINFKKKNLDSYLKKGLPGNKLEDWKFSNINKIISNEIKSLKFYDKSIKEKDNEKISLDLFPSHIKDNNIILLVNGNVKQINISHEDKTKFEIINSFSQINELPKNSLLCLNNAFLHDYFKLIVKKDYKFKKPLVIFNITKKNVENTNINQRFDIELQQNSSLSILNIYEDHSLNNFINFQCQIKIEKDAILKNYKIDFKENSNIKYMNDFVNLERNSVCENFILSYGSKFIKHEIECNLSDEYCSAFINGMINLDENKHHEIRTKINHLAPNTKSYQLIKSVTNNDCKSVYQGKIFVDKLAQKTDGYQLSKSLLLSENSEFNAKPELEIYADDVKCSHGSTSGNLDESSIFYLMSRGLNRKQAQEIIIEGFLLEVLEKITDDEIKKIYYEIIGVSNEY